jgi:hypothetical protein
MFCRHFSIEVSLYCTTGCQHEEYSKSFIFKKKMFAEEITYSGNAVFCNNLAEGLFVVQPKSRKVKQTQHEAYTKVRGAYTILV